jgi:hypothetical protein
LDRAPGGGFASMSRETPNGPSRAGWRPDTGEVRFGSSRGDTAQEARQLRHDVSHIGSWIDSQASVSCLIPYCSSFL